MDDVFPNRLARAIEALTPEQASAILRRAPGAGGIKAAVAMVAGLPSAMVLSNILHGHAPGAKHRQALADTVETDLAWLEGRSEDAPDWFLPPIRAWRRWCRMLDDAGRRAARSDDASQGSAKRGRGRAAAEVELAARALRCDVRDRGLQDLLAGRYGHVDAPLLWSYAEHLGRRRPSHVDHLLRGRDLWRDCEEEFDTLLNKAKGELSRLIPPAPLFRVARAALVAMRQARDYQGKGNREVEDALEILWRQQWFVRGKSRQDVPAAFTTETARTTWTRLRDLRAPYSDDDDFQGRYRSARPKPTA